MAVAMLANKAEDPQKAKDRRLRKRNGFQRRINELITFNGKVISLSAALPQPVHRWPFVATHRQAVAKQS